MSKLQQESLIRKEGLQYQKREAQINKYWQNIYDQIDKCQYLKAEEQARKGEHGLLPRNVEQQNKSRLRRMWEKITQFFPDIHKSLLAERRLSEIANRQ